MKISYVKTLEEKCQKFIQCQNKTNLVIKRPVTQCLKTVASNGPFLSSTKQRLALFSIWTNTFSDPMIKMNIPMIERRFRQMLLIF